MKTVLELTKPEPLTTGGWVDAINKAYGHGITATLQFARTVRLARAALTHGDWTRMCNSGQVPFGIRTAQRWIQIDERVGDLPDATTSSCLPASWTTLYQVSLLSRSIIDDLIANGTISRGLTERAAKQLVELYNGKKTVAAEPDIEQWLQKSRTFLEEHLSTWAGDERDQVSAALAEFIRVIRSAPPYMSTPENAASLPVQRSNLAVNQEDQQ